MTDEHVELFERPFVEELCYTFAGSVFTAFMLFFDGFFTTAETRFGAKLDEFFYFFELAAHSCVKKTLSDCRRCRVAASAVVV